MVIYHAKLLSIHFSPNIYKSLLGKKLTLSDLKCTEPAIYESLAKVGETFLIVSDYLIINSLR
jgi:hypothetical protein